MNVAQPLSTKTFRRVLRWTFAVSSPPRDDVCSQPLPVRLSFAYKKKAGRREYVRVALRPGNDGVVEAVKHPQEGAGVITSLTETDGLAELSEDTTTVEPGSTVGFLSYATLMG